MSIFYEILCILADGDIVEAIKILGSNREDMLEYMHDLISSIDNVDIESLHQSLGKLNRDWIITLLLKVKSDMDEYEDDAS